MESTSRLASSRVRSGFTLIELLVVIAIIAILASILFPVFAQAREKARQTTCLNNIKQVTLGMIQYQQDYDETVPYNTECNNRDLHDNPVPPACIAGRAVLGWVDLVDPYVRNRAVFKCPSDIASPEPLQGELNMQGTVATRGHVFAGTKHADGYYGGQFQSSYGRNDNLANNGSLGTAYLAQIQYPSTTILIMEYAPNSGGGNSPNEHGGSAAYTIVRDPTITGAGCVAYDRQMTNHNLANAFAGLRPEVQAFERKKLSSARHNGGANYGFMDGHAKWIRPERIYGQCVIGFAPNPEGTSGIEFGNNGNDPDFRL